ncbi:hypothetical protein [Chenggangzhangella methanolivorans]|uniref:DUF3035 domain-containing protein n=1 Tax=Chenggangzhangella methanolivorans TaxID=1437009 RepID=A0A9E6UPL6_9HYPH|nr:hypothetical protein [Chenggangzhangella methanolivorans]QZO01549.1 hypothetical protein K6K41_09060 [Chenggangzhangella methanolivorans]
MRQITALVAGAAITVGAASYAGPAFAQQDIGSNPITEFFDGLGMGDKEKPDIDYQERAPLVPPSNTGALPSPQAKGANRDATLWPNDPDVQARKERRARNEVVPTESYSYRMDRSPRMDPDELGARRVQGASVPRGATATASDNQIMRASPDELSGRPVAEVAQPAGARRLTDPPQQYMQGNGVTAAPQPEKKSWLGGLFGGK